MDLKRLYILGILVLASLFIAEEVAVTTPDAQQSIINTMGMVYCLMATILPVIGFVLMVIAAAAYGFGQFFGADSRAKATTWAMACLTGAIIMLLINLIGPMIITSLTGTTAASLATAGDCGA